MKLFKRKNIFFLVLIHSMCTCFLYPNKINEIPNMITPIEIFSDVISDDV